MIYTFYSYKGGVGRSMALANVAQWFYERGLRVVVVDWDMEAPGLETFFYESRKDVEKIHSKLGLLDILISYKQAFSSLRGQDERTVDKQYPDQRNDNTERTSNYAPTKAQENGSFLRVLHKHLPSLESTLIRIKPAEKHSESGRVGAGIWLLSAGWRAGSHFNDYAQAVQKFDWDEFYSDYQGEVYFEWLRDELEKTADVILIDSRTGVTEMGGVCTRQLADVIVSCCAPNDQNLAGLTRMVRSYLREDVGQAREALGRSNVTVVLLPTRVENGENDLLLKFKSDFQKAIQELKGLNIDPESAWDLRIPYTPVYAYKEKLAVGEKDGNPDMVEAYGRLGAYLASLAVKDRVWASQTDRRLQNTLRAEVNRVLGRDMNRTGVFLAYARSDGDMFAAKLREKLESEGISVWQDRKILEGGRDWWLQITDALNNVEFLLLVVTPNALVSEITRKEWRYARQQGVCVYPINASSNLDFSALPRWMRDSHFYDVGTVNNELSGAEWEKLVSDLHNSPNLPRAPFMVGDLPADFVQRPQEIERLVTLLLDQTREEPVATTAAVRGAGGYGKTTIAKALCHDARIQNAFDDGILWVTLNENPGDLTACVDDLIQALSGERSGFSSLEPAIARLVELLADRDILIVIDDVWNPEHLRPFLQGGPRCARLITTRNQQVIPPNAHKLEVDAMRLGEAVALLAAGFEYDTERQGLDNELSKLAATLGEWPLLLKLANGALQNRVLNGDSLRDALDFIKADLIENGLTAFDSDIEEERNRAVSVTLGVSFRLLKESDLARFHELAVFPEDADIPLVTVEKFWVETGKLSRVNSQKLCERLHSFSLLLNFSLKEKRIRLHNVIRKYLIEQQRDRLPEFHAQLLDADSPRSPGAPSFTPAWSEMPDDEPYLWDHLAFHLIGAGRGDQVVATVKDWRYLAKKTLLKKSLSVEGDLVNAEKIVPTDDALRILRRNYVNSGHLFNRCKTGKEVKETIFFRLQHLNELKTMLWEMARNLERPYLAPQFTLPDIPHPALIRTLESHSASVSGCAFSPDGKLIVSASSDNKLKVWDAETGQLLRSLNGHSFPVNGCAFSPDGKLIVSASSDSTLKVWEAETGQLMRSLESHSFPVNGCAFSPDGELIVSASSDTTLKLWDPKTGQIRRTLEGHSLHMNGCAFSPDGKLIVSASADSNLKVWDAETGRMLRSLEGHSLPVNGCAFNPDGKLIVSASSDSTLRVWDAGSGRTLRLLEGHGASVSACAFSPDGKLIVSASSDRTLKLWDAETGQPLRSLVGHSASVSGCAFSPDGRLIVSASLDSTLVWDAKTDQTLRTLEGHSGPVWGCAISPDGKLIVSASDDSTLKVWDAQAGQILRSLAGHSAPVRGCAFSPDSKLIVSASWDSTLRVWNAETGQLLRSLEGHLDYVRGCAFSPDGKLIVSASSDNTLRVWGANTDQMLRALEGHSASVSSCAFSPDGKLIVSASANRALKVWDAEKSQMLRTLEGHSFPVNGCAFSPDGKLIVSASADSTLKVWDAGTGRMLRTLEGHSASVNGCAFSPDGELIVSASWDSTLKVWDAETGRLVATFYADGPINCCAFSNDNALIVVGGARGVYFLKLER